MIALNLVAVAVWFIVGLVFGAVLVLLVNLLVARRLRELLRRAVEAEDEEDDWPAPPRYPPM